MGAPFQRAVRGTISTCVFILGLASSRGLPALEEEIPAAAPRDGVMAGADELAVFHAWAARAFTGTLPPEAPRRADLRLLRQDHSSLRFGRSCLDTPIRIGSRAFEHGLGTHSTSVIEVSVPQGATDFRASAGIDNNFDTQGVRGSVRFSVKLDDREVFRSPIVRGPDEAHEVTVEIPAGARSMHLGVEDAGDGPGHDQADWADARFILEDGGVLRLDENQMDGLVRGLDAPFSFLLDGKPVRLDDWTRSFERKENADRVEYGVTWISPRGDLAVRAIAGVFRDYPAVDWVLHFENRGKTDSGIIEGVRALDVSLATGYEKRPAIIHRLEGDACGDRSFLPVDEALAASKSLRFVSTGGRPSSISAFPFFNFQFADRGLFVALGWSGQWSAGFERAPNGPTRLHAGMEEIRTKLLPGESIRSPRILILAWKGDLEAAHIRFRRLLLFHYAPKEGGRPVRMPFASQCFDRYSWSVPTWATEAGQIAAIEFARSIGCTHHWLDAAWFPGNFPNGVGNWVPKPAEFPRGLAPVGEACRAKGLKFVLWFEPERVAPGTLIAREHPEFVHGGAEGGLFKLDDLRARAWLADLLSRSITDHGVDVYRNDFNMDPLDSWRRNDPPDRKGMTEIRYVEGHYALWDELLRRHPGLLIDNCSSGGRRIDLETIQRSVPLWRSDTSCSPGHPDWNQVQTQGLALYIPLFTACGWTPEPYDFRSAATSGAICQWDYLAPSFPLELARASLAEAKENAPFWYGDFRSLTPADLAPDRWAAYQWHRADRDAGLVLAFRRTSSPYPSISLELRGLDPEAIYEVVSSDDAQRETKTRLSGSAMMRGLEAGIPKKGGSLCIRYRRGTGEP